MKNPLTYNEVQTILDEHRKTKNIKYIQTHVPNRSTGSISQIISKYNKWTEGKRVDESLEKFFEEYQFLAINKLKKIEQSIGPQSLSIDEAIDQLKNAIVQFIDAQVTEQKKKEVETLKQEYETKLQDMQAVMVQAQKTSVIDMLRQKWGHL